MLDPAIIKHKSCSGGTSRPYLHDEFSLICWNVYKNNIKSQLFKPYMQELAARKDLDFILYQEANFKNAQTFDLDNFHFYAAANLEYRGEFYGVLTASRVKTRGSQAYLSSGREALFGTRKSLLMSYYTFRNNDELLIINIHAINFRGDRQYNIELDRILQLAQCHKGAMIVAGDFNAWNNSKINTLWRFTEKLSLKMVKFKDQHKIKSFMRKRLDFIFFRGLSIVESDVLTHPKLSDHNPLYAKFRRS